jgi:hypothetical protein
MNATLAALIKRLGQDDLSSTNVIPWSCPVPSFGDVSNARVATLGLNPSNREFVDQSGKELVGPSRRFQTLGSLGLNRWSDAQPRHTRLVEESCRTYFSGNPYDTWFRQLDYVLAETNVSYYGSRGGACHLDLIPYATSCKWTELSSRQRSSLFSVVGDTLGRLLVESPVRLLILNGSAVVKHFQDVCEIRLERRVMNDWTLSRRSQPDVAGIAYRGGIDNLLGVKLRRDLCVVGFNHNIQSSFGVTREVRVSIRRWIGRIAEQVFL